MTYTPTVYVDGVSPPLSAANLNKSEIGILDATATADAALALAAVIVIATNSQSGTTYTLALTDSDKVLELTSASATVTVTVPQNATIAFPVGSVIEVFRYGAGEVAIAPFAGVTLRSPGGARRLNAQYSAAALRKRATDEWILEGDIKV